jgi:hypothetical protein
MKGSSLYHQSETIFIIQILKKIFTMKTSTLSLALVLMTTLSFSTMFAATLPVEDITIGKTTESISVNWKNMTQQTIHVKILNAKQEVVLEEMVQNQTEFIKQYVVSDFQNGEYNLVISKKSNRITQPFSIQKGALILSGMDKKITYFPILSQKNNQFNVSVFLGYSGTITVKVLDEDKNKIFAQSFTNVSMLHKRFSLNNVADGMYKVEITAGDETFYYSIVK